ENRLPFGRGALPPNLKERVRLKPKRHGPSPFPRGRHNVVQLATISSRILNLHPVHRCTNRQASRRRTERSHPDLAFRQIAFPFSSGFSPTGLSISIEPAATSVHPPAVLPCPRECPSPQPAYRSTPRWPHPGWRLP